MLLYWLLTIIDICLETFIRLARKVLAAVVNMFVYKYTLDISYSHHL